MEVIAETPRRLHDFIQVLGPDGMERPHAAGKWNAREIIAHLADAEIAFSFRLRQILAEDHHTIQPFDQDRWAIHTGAYTAPAALDVFTALRRWNIALMATLKPEDFAKPATHPERGPMTFQTIVDTMAGHDVNHLKQLDRLVASA